MISGRIVLVAAVVSLMAVSGSSLFAQRTPETAAAKKPLPFVSPIFGDNMVLQRRKQKSKQGMEKWKAKYTCHFPTPSTAARYLQNSLRYTNYPAGTKDRADHDHTVQIEFRKSSTRPPVGNEPAT